MSSGTCGSRAGWALAFAVAMVAVLGLVGCGGMTAESTLKIEGGAPQPILEVSDLRASGYTNDGSDIVRFCVYVETDRDTDNDGKADLVKAFLQIPRPAIEGTYKAGVIYDPTPYEAGTYDYTKATDDKTYTNLYREERFDYDSLYRDCQKREPAGEMTTSEAAAAADAARDWNYTAPTSGEQGYAHAKMYDYYLARGYAVVQACGIGTYGSEGFELCATPLERDSHVAVVEWLAHNRRAFTDKTSNIEIRADWSNGNVAMTGCSYGGALSFAVATTGVGGLKTIIPYAGIASWYDYTNSQGVTTILGGNYTDSLAAMNCGGTFRDSDWTVPNDEYGSWLWTVAQDEDAANGNYAPIWAESDYARDWENIRCSALVVQGLNDGTVDARHADKMMQAFDRAGQTAKLVLHQDGHNYTYATMVAGELWYETQNRWLAHYLYDVDNGVEEMPTVLAQSNVDGTWKSYDSWRDFDYLDVAVQSDEDTTEITSSGLGIRVFCFALGVGGDNNGRGRRDAFYQSLRDSPMAAFYPLDLPAGTTVFGVPEVHARLSTNTTGLEGLMVSAVLIDMADDGSEFDAYMSKSRLHDELPVTEAGQFDLTGQTKGTVLSYVQDSTTAKAISYGYTDLTNPGLGDDISAYTDTVDLEAGKAYDYNIYLQPTVYTVRPGHTLYLMLTTWDPYRCFLDKSFTLDIGAPSEIADYDYAYTVDNTRLQVMMPVTR